MHLSYYFFAFGSLSDGQNRLSLLQIRNMQFNASPKCAELQLLWHCFTLGLSNSKTFLYFPTFLNQIISLVVLPHTVLNLPSPWQGRDHPTSTAVLPEGLAAAAMPAGR